MDLFFRAAIYSLTLAAVYLPIAIGLNLIFGVMRILNFAHGELYMLGALFTWLAATKIGLGFFPALLASVIIVAIIGILIERLLLRPLAGDIFAALIVSIGLSLVLQTSTMLIAGSDTKHYAFPFQGTVQIGTINLSIDRVVVAVAGYLGVALFYLILQRTRLGRAIRALAQDKLGATIQGINPSLITAITMALGTALAALAGGLAGSMFGAEPFMGGEMMMLSFIIVALGGMGSMEGTFLASLILGITQSFITIYVGATEATMASFLVLYLIVLVRPAGLFGRVRAGML